MEETRLSKLESEGKFDSTRQRDIFDPLTHQDARCVLVGCGGIGSPTAIALSKLGIPELVLIDHDEVEPHNVPNQLYRISDSNNFKVDALKDLCEQMGASNVKSVGVKANEAPEELRGLVVTGLDSMEARKEVWEMVKMKLVVERLIDARIGKTDIALYCINPMDIDDIRYYEEHCLYSDENAVELACTERAIIDVSFQIAALITRCVRKHFLAEPIERTIAMSEDELDIVKG